MTETSPKITAGIDVGKAQLELSANAGPTQTFANAPEVLSTYTDLRNRLNRNKLAIPAGAVPGSAIGGAA